MVVFEGFEELWRGIDTFEVREERVPQHMGGYNCDIRGLIKYANFTNLSGHVDLHILVIMSSQIFESRNRGMNVLYALLIFRNREFL